MANKLYTDTEIKGKLEVEGEVTFTGATGNGKIIHSTYPNAARIRVQNANQSSSTQVHEKGITISGNGASHYIDDSQVYYWFGKNDWQGKWQMSNVSFQSSYINIYTTGGIQITGGENLNITGSQGGLTVYSIEPDNYNRLWDRKDKFQLKQLALAVSILIFQQAP
ncbi:MAG: hypothetical protein BGO31_19730 [Bacteroidetes bacterium 43-16]|uniref:hypothetical protein n=1 Tax=uncultured Flavobacterium sp. TaxID=165435 RepID=UPI00092A87A6|nr:hypothetical protein [uncultured Flavobacterium sp.]OJV55588.1 MAG: hypothetical protein BGO31_19730 [Bacteroidetes bacterium 43-16]